MERMRTAGMVALVVVMAGCTGVAGPGHGVSAEASAGVDLADLAGWRIVVGDGAIASERYAAEELRRLIREATGRTLEITADPVEGAPGHILIGPAGAGLDADDLGGEDLRIEIEPGRIAITGGRPRGTLYGVYEFAERYMGVRFLTADHTHVPAIERVHRIGPAELTYRPPLRWRVVSTKEILDDPAFRTRLRGNHPVHLGGPKTPAKYGGQSPIAAVNHSIAGFVPVAELGKEHPDWFAEVDGQRLVPENPEWGGHYTTNVCPSHPAVVDRITEKVLEGLRNRPDLELYPVAYGDNDIVCHCGACGAIMSAEGGAAAAPMLKMVNEVARRVDREMPGKMVGTLAYWPTRKPPATIRPAENVIVMLCPIEVSCVHPVDDPNIADNAAFGEDLAGWSRLTPEGNLFIWSYNANIEDYLMAFPNLHLIGDTVRAYVEAGVAGVFMHNAMETRSAELADLRGYVTSRLLWNPSLNDRELIDEFLDLHYGPAAEPIRRHIQLLTRRTLASGVTPTCYGEGPCPTPDPRSDHLGYFGWDLATARRSARLWAEAMRRVKGTEYRARVEKAVIPVLRMQLDGVWHLEGPEELSQDDRRRLLPILRRLLKLADRYELTFESWNRPFAQRRERMQRVFGLAEE